MSSIYKSSKGKKSSLNDLYAASLQKLSQSFTKRKGHVTAGFPYLKPPCKTLYYQELMNAHIHEIGIPLSWNFVEVKKPYSSIYHIAKPIPAVIVIYKPNKHTEKYAQKRETRLISTLFDITTNIFFMQSYVHEYSAMVAIALALINNRDIIEVGKQKPLDVFHREAFDKNPSERADILKDLTGGSFIQDSTTYSSTSFLSSFSFPSNQEHKDELKEFEEYIPENAKKPKSVHYKFLVYIWKEHSMYELNHNKESPLCYGPVSKERFPGFAIHEINNCLRNGPLNTDSLVLALSKDKLIDIPSLVDAMDLENDIEKLLF